MKYLSFLRTLGRRWANQPAPKKKKTRRRDKKLDVEYLETREAPAVAPFVQAVLPMDGTATSSTKPLIRVTFSEAMNRAEVENPANYLLFGSRGNPIPINAVQAITPDASSVIITYNGTAELVSDTYSLFVRGDQIHEAASDDPRVGPLPIAQDAQLVVANKGSPQNPISSSVSLVNILSDVRPNGTTGPLDGTLQAVTNTAVPVTTAAPNPVATAMADMNSDGLLDLVVADAGPNQVYIYLGQSGGRFEATPSLTLILAPGGQGGTTAANPSDLVVADFDGRFGPDIAVTARGTDNVRVFFNNGGGGGSLQFRPELAVDTGQGQPVAIASADFDQNNFLDLVVVNGQADANGFINAVLLLFDTRAGTFNAGSRSFFPTGVLGVTDVAAEDVAGNGSPDVIIAANSGLTVHVVRPRVVGDAGTTPVVLPRVPPVAGLDTLVTLTGQSITSVGVQDLDNDGRRDVVGTTGGNNVLVFRNQGNASFSAGQAFAASVPAPNPPGTQLPAPPDKVVLYDVTGDGRRDVVVTNFYPQAQNPPPPREGFVTVLVNQSITGSGQIRFAPAVSSRVDQEPIFVAAPDVNRARPFTQEALNSDGLPDSIDTNNDNFPDTAQDVNGDQFPDLVTLNRFAQDVTLLRGRGDGTFLTTRDFRLPANVDPQAIAVGDFNNDLLQDFVFVNNAQFGGLDTAEVYLRNAAGDYDTPAPPTPRVGRRPVAVATGDFNSDGRLDIVTVNQNDSTVSILLNNPAQVAGQDGKLFVRSLRPNSGSGVFDLPVGQAPTGVVVADFNRDGVLDLAVSHRGNGIISRGVSLLLGNAAARGRGNGTFAAATEFATNVAAEAIAVGDFDKDGRNDVMIVDRVNNAVVRLLGDGAGSFLPGRSFGTGPNPNSITTGDINRDGFTDVVVTTTGNQGVTAFGGVSVLLNTAGGGFTTSLETTAIPTTLNVPFVTGTPVLASVAVTNINQDFFPDVVVTANLFTQIGLQGGLVNNVFTLIGNGDGSFKPPQAYAAGVYRDGAPSFVGVTSDPLIKLTTFSTGGIVVSSNLIKNGGFESLDLTGEKGNLTGWKTFDLPGSKGRWNPQSGVLSPESSTAILPAPLGNFAAALDQADLDVVARAPASNLPPGVFDETTAGAHILYQDFIIPPGATSVQLSFRLYIDNTANNAWSNTIVDPSLDYALSIQNRVDNQQFRIDILDPSAPLTNVPPPGQATGNGVLRNIFTTTPATDFGTSRDGLGLRYARPNELVNDGLNLANLELTGLKDPANRNRVVRLRFAGVNNRGRLLVGVDNVQVQTLFEDRQIPTVAGLQLRNPGFGATLTFGGTSNDATIVGRVGDDGGVDNVRFIQFDMDNDGFPADTIANSLRDPKVTSFDPDGNFTFTLPTELPGRYTIPVRVVDRAGNVASNSLNFIYQYDPTDYANADQRAWQADGTNETRVTGAGVNYRFLTGRVNSVALDPRDASGNIYYIGTIGGGVWKTTNAGNDWTPLTDFITIRDVNNGEVLPQPIGAVGIDPTVLPDGNIVIYAGTGVADTSFDSRGGYGILKSVDSGRTWTLVGQSEFGGARITKIVVNNLHIVYVAVAAGGSGPGLYRSDDGGRTWRNTLTPDTMFLEPPGTGGTLATRFPGAGIGTVTDVDIEGLAFGEEVLYVGIGNIGLGVAPSPSGGVWKSQNRGETWQQVIGKQNGAIPNIFTEHDRLRQTTHTLPNGTNVGRVTLAVPAEVRAGVRSDERFVYALISNATTKQAGTSPDDQNQDGLFLSRTGGEQWTRVMLKQSINVTSPHNFVNFDMVGGEGDSVGDLVVDPNNPNVVYVGGSRRFFHLPVQFGVSLNKGLLRVDTRNISLAGDAGNPVGTRGRLPGDDRDKLAAAQPNLVYPDASNEQYVGEGVFWYDLERDTSGAPSTRSNLYTRVHALAIDDQGRLITGTDGGIWRANLYGFAYDYGFNGILTGRNQANLGMREVWNDAVHGNLQIASNFSVDVDPRDRQTLYVGQVGVGWARTDGALNWQIMGPAVTGGLIGLTESVGEVRVGPIDPTLPASTPTTVYVATGFGSTARVFKSISGGDLGTFSNAFTGIRADDSRDANPAPPLSVQPVKQRDPDEQTLQDHLLIGTSNVYASDDGASTWDNVPLLNSSVITATEISLIDDPIRPGEKLDVYYAGTSNGRLFVSLDDGRTFPDRSNGLPGGPIQDIEVDRDNASLAYVVIGGTGTPKVFRTTDAGQNWVNISGNLPDIPAYSIAADPRRLQVQPRGKLYVGTETGVFASTDEGATWRRLGQGIPNAPVLELQFTDTHERLVGATLGRSTFEISTDFIGPRIIGFTPGTPVTSGISSVVVQFTDPVDPRTFTVADVRDLRGPNGPISVISVEDLDPLNHQRFAINFLPQNVDGQYFVTVGPDIRDLFGNVMDQNSNFNNGELPGDGFSARFLINTTDNGRLVSGMFHDLFDSQPDLLDRPVDTDGFLTYIGNLDMARFRALSERAYGFASGDEARLNYLAGFYTDVSGRGAASYLPTRNLLGRAPDAQGLNDWLQFLKNGGTPEQVISIFLGTDEYYRANGGIDSQFVVSAYEDVLRRQPTAAEFNTFLARANVTPRVNVANSFIFSVEYQNVLVARAYDRLLGRPGSLAEIKFWVDQILNGLRREEVLAQIAGSQEYFNRAPSVPEVGGGAPTSRTFVQALYINLLARTATTAEADAWAALIDGGLARDEAARRLIGSREYRTKLLNLPTEDPNSILTVGAYPKFLNRQPAQAEVDAWLALFDQGLFTDIVIAGFAASVEYFNTEGAGSSNQSGKDDLWLNSVYQDLLGRAPDGVGRPIYLQNMAAAETSARAEVAATLPFTDDYRTLLVNTAYADLLKRQLPPGPGEVQVWLPLLRERNNTPGGVAPTEQFFGNVLSSEEYFKLEQNKEDRVEQGRPTRVSTNSGWVLGAYRDLLKRPADQAGFDTNQDAILASYFSERLALSTALTTSVEYRTRLITGFYNQYLRRNPTAPELQRDLASLAGNATTQALTDEQLIVQIVSSVEYFENPDLGAGNNDRFVNQLYLDILQRSRDPGSQQYVNDLNTGRRNRAEIATILLISPEYQNRLIDIYYSLYLNRPGAASPAEENFWRNQLNNGVTAEQVISLILASREYFLIQHPFP